MGRSSCDPRCVGRQDFDEAVESILLENARDLEAMPEDVPRTIPGIRVIASDARGSYPLKNAGVRAATADLVMVLDADCVPDAGWVRAGVEAMRQRPDAVAISGRTTYPGRSTLERSLGLLSRCYVDRGTAGPVRLLSTNNMIVRRSVFRSDPLPDDAGPFAYRLLTERLLRQGGKLYFEPRCERCTISRAGQWSGTCAGRWDGLRFASGSSTRTFRGQQR